MDVMTFQRTEFLIRTMQLVKTGNGLLSCPKPKYSNLEQVS